MKLLLFDLDGTLLDNEKNISKRTLAALHACREKGILIGVSTSRGEQNSLTFLAELQPDILISSGGALVKKGAEYIYKAEMSPRETRQMIETARRICGNDCEITVDTLTSHYWNYKIDPKTQDKTWGDSIYTDFTDFDQPALKVCVEIFDPQKAEGLKALLSEYDCVRFSDGFWYKFTKAGITKEKAIHIVCDACNITLEDITAFGDDFADIGMLKLCGVGIAMGNAIDEVKAIADLVIGRNDEDGIAEYVEKEVLTEKKEIFDCGFTRENNWFRYRAGAIIIENGCVLFAGNANEDYLYSIGGGVHMGETAEDAVLREVFEETGVHYEIDRLAVIHENFFNENAGSLKGLNCHEISFYFLMKPRGTQELHSDSYTYGVKEEMYWIPIEELSKYKAFPSFLKEYLSREHAGIEHIITDERK